MNSSAGISGGSSLPQFVQVFSLAGTNVQQWEQYRLSSTIASSYMNLLYIPSILIDFDKKNNHYGNVYTIHHTCASRLFGTPGYAVCIFPIETFAVLCPMRAPARTCGK
jgi:hypothetical protein